MVKNKSNNVICQVCGAKNILGDEHCSSCHSDLDLAVSSLSPSEDSFSDELLNRKVIEIAGGKAAVLKKNSLVSSAIDAMNETGRDIVIIEEEGRVEGIFTVRDIIYRVLSKNLDSNKTKLGDVMTENVEVIEKDEPIASALHKMAFTATRHLPIMKDGLYLDTVSIDDIMKYFSDELEKASL
ncbi:MAG: hypothetical protein COS94_05330 [Candidatus Hydrogenedentes bacterium CG07_land_8_20_14_0_80_42_17]|nr:MAG: hypothetical protein COS94_05330 [Candidatus Hydrogenedentes bacterium CG07_land_8_20_14_0_80_42_17]